MDKAFAAAGGVTHAPSTVVVPGSHNAGGACQTPAGARGEVTALGRS